MSTDTTSTRQADDHGKSSTSRWSSEWEKLYKLAAIFREQAAKSQNRDMREQFLAQAIYYDELAYHAELDELLQPYQIIARPS